MPSTELGVLLSGSAVCIMIASVLSGALSDHLGRRKSMLLCGAVSLLCIPPLYLGLGQAHAIGAIAAYTVALCTVGTFCYAPLLIVLNERFPTEIRSTGTAVSWNIGFAIGGSMPTIVSLVTGQASALPTTLAIACALTSLVYLAVVLFTPETKDAMR
jgi:MFS family permease